MPRALLAWEGGDGRGHIVTLRTVAEAIGDRFSFDAALCRLTHSDELAPLCDAVVRGPWLPHSREYREQQGNPPTSTWGEFMGDIGFTRPTILRKSIAWWQQVMRDRNISLVIGESAPCALLAARGLGIPSVALGSGYLLPPSEMETFPVLLPRYSTRIHDETGIVDIVNAVGTDFGIPELRHLPEVYASSDALVFTLTMLDPYSRWRAAPLLPPVIGGAPEPADEGEEIFVYFSTSEASEPDLVEAISNLPLPVRLYMPSADDEMAASLARRGVHVERSPVSPHLIARRSRLIVNAGQHGILCLALASGLPQVAAPQHLEHEFHSTAVERCGAATVVNKSERNAERFHSAILDAYEDAAMALRARHLAEELRPQFSACQRDLIGQRIEALMG
jgi:UDP:flavonoid glycosyltransferase YjiC (YdhE family)